MTKKNIAKGESFQYAFRRIKEARAAGFHLEVIALSESIISDRLMSYVDHFHHADVEMKTGLGNLLDRWKSLDGSRTWDASYGTWEDLHAAVDGWRGNRNETLHRACKSLPGTPTKPVADFEELAAATSEEGALLARAVCDWFKASKRSGKP